VTILAVQQEGARMALLMAGQICCTVAQVQDRALLEKTNFHMLFDMTTLGIANAQGVIATKRACAKDHPDVIQHFMDALIESIARSKNDRAGSLPVLKEQLMLEDDAIAAATYDFLHRPGRPERACAHGGAVRRRHRDPDEAERQARGLRRSSLHRHVISGPRPQARPGQAPVARGDQTGHRPER